MRYFLIIILLFTIQSCIQKNKLHVNDLKQGSFKTTLEDDEIISFATRNDSIQIEDFNGVKDTFRIRWIDQFEYILVKKNPKTMLDSTPFHVKITGVKDNSYTFSAYYKGSKFKQKGTAVKLD